MISLGTVVAGQAWLISFLEYDPGYFDRDQDRVEPGLNPFAPDTVSTMCPECTEQEWWAR